MPPPAMNRRDFVWSAAKVTAILALAGCLGEEEHPASPEPSEAEGFDRTTLAAVCDRLLPGTPGALPSATEVGVADFVVRALDEPMFTKRVKPFVAKGLAHLSAEAQKASGAPFAKLAPADQDTLLRRFQENDVAIPDFSASRWFELVITFALEGWLGPPSRGANKDGKTWDALGIVWPR